MPKKKGGLGRGLDVFFGDDDHPGILEDDRSAKFIEVPITEVRAGRYQPRTQMDEAALTDLAASIREQGVLSPILVRPLEAGGYEVLAGERRLRAAKIAGMETVPVILRSVSDENALVIGLIENIQRENLNPIEEAQGLQRLKIGRASCRERV